MRNFDVRFSALIHNNNIVNIEIEEEFLNRKTTTKNNLFLFYLRPIFRFVHEIVKIFLVFNANVMIYL